MKQVKKYKLIALNTPDVDQENKTEVDKPVMSPSLTMSKSSESKQRKMSHDMILMSMPKALKYKAKALLNYLEDLSIIDWDDQGQVLIDHDLIPQSHISDLIKCAIFPYKNFHPTGMTSFQAMLAQHNIPKSLLHQQSGSGLLLPPPGIPLKAVSDKVVIAPKSIKQPVTWMKL